jgi:hypothetical protein
VVFSFHFLSLFFSSLYSHHFSSSSFLDTLKSVATNLIATFQHKLRQAGIEMNASAVKGIGDIPRLKKYAHSFLFSLPPPC